MAITPWKNGEIFLVEENGNVTRDIFIPRLISKTPLPQQIVEQIAYMHILCFFSEGEV